MKRGISFLLAAVLLLTLGGCGGTGAAEETQQTQETQGAVMDLSGKYVLDEGRNEAIIDDAGQVTAANEGNNRLFYHIFVGSFSDSNGDGIGDLRGIINRFDYLNDGMENSGVSLGVEGIWLSPIFLSPSYHKYDTTDYYVIDPQFGTMEDLNELIDLCHARGVKIILDLVINHTARNHQWFQSFSAAQKDGIENDMYYDFYSWAEESTPGAAWYKVSGTSRYYEGNFSSEMPELNFDNETVRQAIVDVAKYYLDLGVDGFRFDAAKYIYYGNEGRNAEFWKWFMAELRNIKPDIYTVAEVWDSDGVTYPYFASTNCFNFTMAQTNGRIAEAAKAGDVNVFTSYVSNYISDIQAQNPDAMPVTFIANHDTDRAAGFLTVSSGQAMVAANLSILMPGSTFVYYGEEIGMKGSRGGANTDANRRLAMNWGDGDTVKDPIGADYTSGQTNGTVADQLPDGNSLYNHYKKLIQLRKANPEIANGSYTPLQLEGKVGGYIATYNGSSVVVIHNTTQETVQIDLAAVTDLELTVIAGFAGVNGAVLEGTVLTLDGQTSVILK